MKTRIQDLALIVLAAVSCVSNAHAKGGNVGSGGLAFVCRNADGGIKSAQLVDLAEAEGADLRPLIDRELSKENALTQVLVNLDKHGVQGAETIRKEILAGVENIRGKMIPVGAGNFGLIDPKDYDLRITKPGCAPEVVGLYDDARDILRVNREIYAALSGRDQIAFEIHEILFKFSRLTFNGIRGSFSQFEDELTRSNRVRELVGVLFSDPSKPYDRRLVDMEPRNEIENKYAMITRRLDCSYNRQSPLPVENKPFLIYPFEKSKEILIIGNFIEHAPIKSSRVVQPDYLVSTSWFKQKDGIFTVNHTYYTITSGYKVVGAISNSTGPSFTISKILESDRLSYTNTARPDSLLEATCQVLSSANELK